MGGTLVSCVRCCWREMCLQCTGVSRIRVLLLVVLLEKATRRRDRGHWQCGPRWRRKRFRIRRSEVGRILPTNGKSCSVFNVRVEDLELFSQDLEQSVQSQKCSDDAGRAVVVAFMALDVRSRNFTFVRDGTSMG